MEGKKNIFISYKHKDRDNELIYSIVDRLEKDNYDVWIDKRKILPGDVQLIEIKEGLFKCDIVIAFITEEYMQSEYCKLEFKYANNDRNNKICLYVCLEQLDKKTENDFSVYLFGDVARLDAIKHKKENKDEYADVLFEILQQSIRKQLLKVENTLFDKTELKRVDFFTGRDDVFEKVNLAFEMDKRVSLYGVPGVGKTSCANEYINRQMTKGHIKQVMWFDADSKIKVSEAVFRFAKKINKSEIPDIEAATNVLIKHVNEEGNYHIVFDNVDNFDDVANLVAKLKAHFIITTRMEKVSNYANIKINPFDVDLARKYLKSALPDLPDQYINAIIRDVERNKQLLPHKISLIAGLLNDDPTITVEECLQNIKGDNLILNIVINLEKGKFKDAIKILQCSSLLDSDNIQGNLLKAMKLQQPLKEALQKLTKNNICKIVFPNSPHFGIAIHRIFQDDLVNIFSKNDSYHLKKELIIEILEVINNLFPLTNYYSSEKWQQAINYSNHVIKILSFNNENNTKTCQLQYKLGFYYLNIMQDIKMALASLNKSLEMRQRLFVGDHPEVADSLDAVGASYSRLGNDKKYLKHSLLALEMRQRLFAGDHPQVADSLKAVGISYSRLGNDKKYLEYSLQALEMRQRLFVSDHPSLADSLNAVGISYGRLGDDKKANEYILLALEMRQRLFVGDHPEVADSLNDVGISYEHLGDDNKANEYKLLALEMRQRLFVGDHPEVATSLNAVGASYSRLGNDNKYLEYSLIALEMRKRLFLDDHPEVADSLNDVGISYEHLGDDIKANEYKLLALEMRQRLFVGDHPEVATSLNAVGASYSRLGDTRKANEYSLLALEMRQRLFVGDHPSLADSLNAVGISYGRLGDYKKANEYKLLGIEMRQRLFVGDHSEVADSLNAVGISYSLLGDDKKANEYILLALEMRQRLFVGDHPEVADSLNAVGASYLQLGDDKKDLEYSLLALKMRQRLFVGDHLEVADSLNSVEISYSQLGDDKKALEYSLLALEMRQRLFAGDHPQVADSLNAVGASYSRLGNDIKANEYLPLALEMRQRLFVSDHPSLADSLN